MRKVQRDRTRRKQQGGDRQVSTEGASKVQVDCCYCMTTNYVEEPPCLVDCSKCGRPFRVLRDMRGGGSKMELSSDALGYFARSPKTA